MHETAPASRPSTPADARLAHFRLLPAATTVVFTTRHLLGLAGVAGTVQVLGGRMAVDTAAWRLELLEVELDMTSFASASRARDRVVASPAFLHTAAHPTAFYRSSRSERTADGWSVQGALTVKGIASPVELQVGDLDPATALTARATASIDRFAYGIAIPTALAARRLQVEITARAERVAA